MTERRASRDEEDASGVVLAGGESIRMGRDKALLPFAGRPLIEYALHLLREAGLSTTIAGASATTESTLAAYAPIVRDPQRGLGPLAGICAALNAVSTRHVVLLPIDLPLLPASLIAYLLHHAQITGHAVTVPSMNGFKQTFPVVLDRAVLPALEIELDSGRGGCFSSFQAASSSFHQPISVVAVELLAQSGQVAHPFGLSPFRWFLNLNSPQDLARATSLRAHSIA